MKLYVWDDVLEDYTTGIMFALAESEDDARKQLLAECYYIPERDLARQPKVYTMKNTTARVIWGGG
jgi:hypothetical protein